MPTYSAKTNVQRLTGQPLAYAPKSVQVQRNNAENHQPPLSRMVIRRLVFILFSTSELGVTFVVCRGLGSLKNSVVGSVNCPVLHKLFIKNDIILIQEHWLFQAQIHLIGELHSQINYAAKGVDINDPHDTQAGIHSFLNV
jgi:hypothetical protein